MPERSYRASIKVSAGHFPDARPDDWTEVTVEHTVQAHSLLGARIAIREYARDRFNLGPLIDAEGTDVTVDVSLIAAGDR